METLLDAVSISSGGSQTVQCAKDPRERMAFLLTGDSNATDVDVSVSGVAVDRTATPDYAPVSGDSVTAVDASSTDAAFTLDADGYRLVELTVTNNAASATTLTLSEADF